MVSTMRNTTAAPAPQMIALFCWCLGNERAASAITTALSPDRMMLTQMMAPSPSQNCDVRTSCMAVSSRWPRYPRRSEQSDDFPVDDVDLVPQSVLFLVHELEVALALAELDHDARELRCALAAVAPVRREHDLGAEFLDPRLEQIQLLLRVLVETVDRDHAGNAVVLLHVLDVALEVGDPFSNRREVFLGDGFQIGAAVILHRANCRDDHGGRGPQARFAALAVDEFLRAEIRTAAD